MPTYHTVVLGEVRVVTDAFVRQALQVGDAQVIGQVHLAGLRPMVRFSASGIVRKMTRLTAGAPPQ